MERMDDAPVVPVSGFRRRSWEQWSRASDRNVALLIRLFVGDSTAEVAERFGLSVARIKQIENKYDVIRMRRVRVQRRVCAQCRLTYEVGSWRTHIRSADHFWRQVDTSGDGCWEWQGYRLPRGYGHFASSSAHRRSWELTNGPIPEGRWVLHHCDNPPCVRPDHLYAGTASDNAQDRERRGRGNHPTGPLAGGGRPRETCLRAGHPMTPENTNSNGKAGRICKLCSRERSARYRAGQKAA